MSTTNGGTTTLASNISYTGAAVAAVHIKSMSLGNGVYTYGASYDLDQRLTSSSLTRSNDSTQLYQTQPGYDAVGNVSNVTTTLQAGTDIQHFCYDEQNRLTAASANGTIACGAFTAGTLTSAQYQQSYAYDTNGRLTSGPQGSYSYGNSSHLHAVTSTGNGYSAAYDAAGNMTCRAPSSTTTCSGTQTGQQLSYDLEGNLSTWQNQPSSTSTVNYLYDGEGTRVASQLVSGGNTTLTSYLGKLETIVAGSSSTTTTYYFAGALRIAEAVNGTFSYLGNDVLGSTAVALNAAGQLTAAQLYGPYGNVRYNSGTMPTDIGFTGQRGDSATGLDYYNARYYDPVVGLFISADTVLPGNGYDPWGLSRYAYVRGNPETMTDPTGQRFISSDGTQVGQIGILVSPNNPRPPSLPPRRPSNRGNGGKNPGTGGKKVTQADATHMLFDLCMSSSDCTNHYLWEKAKYAAMQTLLDVAIAFDGAGLLFGHPPSVDQTEQDLEREAEDNTVLADSLNCSFASQTSVTTIHGKQAIGTLHSGEEVWSYNPKTHRMEWEPIVHVWVTHDDDLADLTIMPLRSTHNGKEKAQSGEVIHTNQKHRFLTTELGFLQVSAITVGMHIAQADGSIGLVVKRVTVPGSQAMYNLEVAQNHTFVVGDDQWIVHNECWDLPDHIIAEHVRIDPSEVYTKAQQTRSQAAGAFFNADVAKKAVVDAVTNGVGTYQVNRDTGVTEATFKVSLTEDVGYIVAKNAKGQWEYYDTGNVTVVLSQNSQGLWYLKTAYPTP